MTSGKSSAVEWLDIQGQIFFGVSDRIWGFAEPALREYRSSRLLVEYLEKNGFNVTVGISGMPTAFLATWGEGRPILGFYAEYDATPGESKNMTMVGGVGTFMGPVLGSFLLPGGLEYLRFMGEYRFITY